MNITAIIPCLNGIDTVERAIVSAINAGCHEVLVFDDASTDGTFTLLKSLIPKYPQLMIFSLGNGLRSGASFARNYLISHATDGLIICLDADDELCNLAPLVAAYEPNVWCYGDYNEHSGDSIQRIKGAASGALARKNISGVTFLVSKSDLLKVGGFNTDFAVLEDYALQCALVHGGIRAKYVDTVIYERYLNPRGNERTALAGIHWAFYQAMARRKYPNVFANVG